MDIWALAKATADTKAFAYASMSTGIHEFAYGLDTGSVASIALDNQLNGTLSIIAQATANADGGTKASASAYIENTEFYQYAYFAETLTVGLTNAGTLDIEALAKRPTPPTTPRPMPISITGSTNTPMSPARRFSPAPASATPRAPTSISLPRQMPSEKPRPTRPQHSSYGIDQYAFWGEKSVASLTNNGTLDIAGKAVATGTSDKSYA